MKRMFKAYAKRYVSNVTFSGYWQHSSFWIPAATIAEASVKLSDHLGPDWTISNLGQEDGEVLL